MHTNMYTHHLSDSVYVFHRWWMDVKPQVASWRWGWRSESLYQELISSQWQRSGWCSIQSPPFLRQRDKRNEWVEFSVYHTCMSVTLRGNQSRANSCIFVWAGFLMRAKKNVQTSHKGSSWPGHSLWKLQRPAIFLPTKCSTMHAFKERWFQSVKLNPQLNDYCSLSPL